MKICKIRNITDLKKMSPWIININLTFIEKALKVSIYVYIYHNAERCISPLLDIPRFFRNMHPSTPLSTPPITGKYQVLWWYTRIKEAENN